MELNINTFGLFHCYDGNGNLTGYGILLINYSFDIEKCILILMQRQSCCDRIEYQNLNKNPLKKCITTI